MRSSVIFTITLSYDKTIQYFDLLGVIIKQKGIMIS